MISDTLVIPHITSSENISRKKDSHPIVDANDNSHTTASSTEKNMAYNCQWFIDANEAIKMLSC